MVPPATLAPRRREDQEIKDNLGYIATFCPKQNELSRTRAYASNDKLRLCSGD